MRWEMGKVVRACGSLILAVTLPGFVVGQDPGGGEGETCPGPVSSAKEVTRKAKITYRREPAFTEEARAHGTEGEVVLTAVWCRTGKVTDIKVIKGLPDGLTEAAVEATRGTKFEPAEKGGELVSQHLKRVFHF